MNELELKFESFSIDKHEPFPTVYIDCDSHNMTVWFEIFIKYAQEKGGLTIDKVKSYISQMVDIDEWEVERDVPCRMVELYGIKKLLKTKYKNGVKEKEDVRYL